MSSKPFVFTGKEETANAITHCAMAGVALLAMPFALLWSYAKGGVLDAVGVSVFVVSVFLMLLGSGLYHAMEPGSRHKEVFRVLDHMFIYVAIAGSYTPIALSVIRGWQGIVIVVVQWVMVIFGILYKVFSKRHIPKASLAIYLIMGWTVVLFLPTFLSHASTGLIISILAGGICYSLGTLFYANNWFRYHHMIWHLMVNLGALCHFVGIVFFLR